MSCFSQKTFSVDRHFLDTLSFDNYKVFIVSKQADINFIGKNIPENKRFTPDTVEAKETNKAIQTDYASARERQLKKQIKADNFSDSADWRKAVQNYKEHKDKLFRTFETEQKKKIQNFDRYFWGYYNDDNQRLILIRFDPHKIKHYTIASESFIDTLTIMVYNLETKTLCLAGWADFKE